jgi:hypothetical protein
MNQDVRTNKKRSDQVPSRSDGKGDYLLEGHETNKSKKGIPETSAILREHMRIG